MVIKIAGPRLGMAVDTQAPKPALTVQEEFISEEIYSYSTPISDVQLAIFSNIVGVVLFLLVVGYHYIAANSKPIAKVK